MNADRLITHISRYISINDADKANITTSFTSKKLNKKEVLLRNGETCKTENFIVKGCLRTYTIDENGFEHILMFGIEDWWVGDLYSFLTNTPSQYVIDALEDTELLQISRPNLEKLYKSVPALERFFRLLIQNAYIAQQQRVNQNLSQTAEQRYLAFVAKYPEHLQRIPQKHIASYLGITPVFLSMLRKKLSRQ